MPTHADPIVFLRLPDVIARTGLPRSSLYDLIAKGQFPAPVRLSVGRVAWDESAVTAWQRDRLAQHDANPIKRGGAA